jgi:hypothetical protein
MLYRESQRGRRFVPPAGADFNRASGGMRRMHDKNNNSHPRSEVRKHMGSRAHVPAGNSLSVGHTPHSLTALERSCAAKCGGAASREPA